MLSFTGSSSRRIPNNRSRLRGSGFRKNQSATAKAGKIYNSYNDFKISKYPKGSPQWQAEVIKYLLDMKAHGHRIKTVETNKVSHFQSKSLKYPTLRTLRRQPRIYLTILTPFMGYGDKNFIPTVC